MHPWSQLLSLGFSILGLVFAVLPRAPARDSFGETPAAQTIPSRFFRLPVFWATFAMLGYIAVQGLNPAWRLVSDAESWWLEPEAHIAWLPTGIAAPFASSNSWRTLVVAASLSLLIGSLWLGLHRRKSYRILFTLLVGNGVLLAVLGLAQKLSEAESIFWSYLPSNHLFMASFIYPNHAGAYFNLLVALATGLGWWRYQRAYSHLEGKMPARALMFAGVFIAMAVIFSGSRMSMILLAAFTVLVLGVLVWRRRKPGPIREHPEFLPFAFVLGGVLGLAVILPQAGKLRERFAAVITRPAEFLHDRVLVRQATFEMFGDRWLFGWGAGGYRHAFPLYAQKYPEIHLNGTGGRKYWEHAHNDWLEFPAELGVVGMLPLLALLAAGARELQRRKFRHNPVSFCAVLGCVLLLVHGSVDFVFQNPAVLFTWSVLFIGAARWSALDRPGFGQAMPAPLRPQPE